MAGKNFIGVIVKTAKSYSKEAKQEANTPSTAMLLPTGNGAYAPEKDHSNSHFHFFFKFNNTEKFDF